MGQRSRYSLGLSANLWCSLDGDRPVKWSCRFLVVTKGRALTKAQTKRKAKNYLSTWQLRLSFIWGLEMSTQHIENLLERIAIALERVAMVLEGVAKLPNSPSYNTVSEKIHHDDEKIHADTLKIRSNGVASAAAPSSQTSDQQAFLILEPFLNSRGIRIKCWPVEDAADNVIDSLSFFLGDHYDALSSLLSKIKRAMQAGMPITENLKGRTQQDINDICQFCTRLHEVAFLEQYQYYRSPTYTIKAKTTTLSKAQRFFSGQWLERFILQKVKAIHSLIASEIPGGLWFEYLINPQITLPNGDNFELDILAAIGSSIYWIEAKSGDYQQHVSKYSKFARLIGLDFEHSIMVLTDLPEDRCEALSLLFSMTVCNLRTFEKTLLSIARNDINKQSAMRQVLSPPGPLMSSS